MSKNICEKCGKKFNTISNYINHQKRKTPCIKKIDECSIIINSNDLIETNKNNITIDISIFNEIKIYYDTILNNDKSTYKSSNDEPTPIDCIIEMINKIPQELWKRNELSILDPCCGNGNFAIPIIYELLKYHDKKIILEQILEFNDITPTKKINGTRLFIFIHFKTMF